MSTNRKLFFISSLAILALIAASFSYPVHAEPSLTFTVNASSDIIDSLPGDGICETAPGNGICTLRAAIMEANAHIGSDTIILPAATYLLTIPGTGEDAGASGDLDIKESLNIQGENENMTIISALGLGDRVLEITQFATAVSLSNINIKQGSTNDLGGGIANRGASLQLNHVDINMNSANLGGGGIYSNGPLIISNSRIETNNTPAPGGGIYSVATLNIENSTIANNTASQSGGGILAGSTSPLFILNTNITGNVANLGGGIYASNALGLNDGVVDDNSATTGGGLYLDNGALAVIINRTYFNRNSASDSGGAIYNKSANLSLISFAFNENSASMYGSAVYNSGNVTMSAGGFTANQGAIMGGGIYNVGGSIYANNVLFENNHTSATGGGGAIGNYSGITNLVRVELANNSAYMGGAIVNGGAGVLQMTDSTVISNTSELEGGGIKNLGLLALIKVTINANHSTNGGGVYNQASLDITNSTISGNTALDNGAGILSDGTSTVNNSTITKNMASSDGIGGNGGGIYIDPPSTLNIKNSILFDNHYRILSNIYDNDCYGTMTTQHYNLIGTLDNCTLNNSQGLDLIGVDALLGSLADNGGSTKTHALLIGSPAIDAANPVGCKDAGNNLIQRDQRGYLRHWDGNADGSARCDIGSYEYDSVMVFFLPLVNK